MIAEYTVKRNGRWYKAGDEIPDIVPGEKSSGGYTKTEINRIEGAEEISGAELKRILIEQFGL